VFTYIKNNTPKNSVIAVYPYGKTNLSLFWIREYQRPLINPQGYLNKDASFDAKDFTAKLDSCEGLIDAKNLGVTHLVYFYIRDKNFIETENFFSRSPLLIRVTTFEGTHPEQEVLGFYNPYLKIINTGNTLSNSAILYKLNDKIDYKDLKQKCL